VLTFSAHTASPDARPLLRSSVALSEAPAQRMGQQLAWRRSAEEQKMFGGAGFRLC
jgi:hypothetical protein